MCGNFGLVTLISSSSEQNGKLLATSREVQANVPSDEEEDEDERMLRPPLAILQTMTSSTEIRGGQAGGISCIEQSQKNNKIYTSRVRDVARKRHPLASDLIQKFTLHSTSHHSVTKKIEPQCATYIGHTRFATASMNTEPELHPHEWVPFHTEYVWQYNTISKTLERNEMSVGIHITHNGDFDILNAYSRKMVNSEVGLWLERVLHCPNHLKGDSPKVAGCMDLLRVQGRWSAAARLAYIRILDSPLQVTGGLSLSKEAPNMFPNEHYWHSWAIFFEKIWSLHKSNIIRPSPLDDEHYRIDLISEHQFVTNLVEAFTHYNSQFSIDFDVDNAGGISKDVYDDLPEISDSMYTKDWSSLTVYTFMKHTVRGFLRFDLYTAMTEFLSRAEGSFGLQVHSTLELGVVVIASKGQPMCVAYDPSINMVLFGSEAQAVEVPVDTYSGAMPTRIDLDAHGEVARIGAPRHLFEGVFAPEELWNKHRGAENRSQRYSQKDVKFFISAGDIEIRFYNLVTATEVTSTQLKQRMISVSTTVLPYDPNADQVGNDLRDLPRILNTIDKAWENWTSSEHIAGLALAETLNECMHRRLANNLDTIDLIIAGAEASLWVAEQFSSDLKITFPQLNVMTISTNKLLGLGCENSERVYFPGADEVLSRRLDQSTCALLISQSGQTFPSLHATHKLSELVKNRLWLLTGCVDSKMQLAMIEYYHRAGMVYGNNRVIINHSGFRPAEPTSAAIVATMHSLTRLFIRIIEVTRNMRHNSVLNLDSMLDEGPDKAKKIVLALTRGGAEDLKDLVRTSTEHNIPALVGHNVDGKPLPSGEDITYKALQKQGRTWGAHISEPWRILVFVFFYILISVGAEMPIFCLCGDVVLAVICSVYPDLEAGKLAFSPRDFYYNGEKQRSVYTIIGAVLQVADALFFIFLPKIFTWLDRWLSGRPIWARHGKRTIVIVDTPCVHQLVEAFVSKLYSQSYSFCSVDVHGASGLDHFVHRFTHRVVRGVLLAVGRPDGRMMYLAKSEASVLLAVKQAVFIRNPEYSGEGSGPDVLTIGHNPFQPNLGLCNSITLPSITRRKFFDEYAFENVEHGDEDVDPLPRLFRQYSVSLKEPARSESVCSDFSVDPIGDVSQNTRGLSILKTVSNDPAIRGAFGTRIESSKRLQIAAESSHTYAKLVQYLYESRCASMERYVAFCVIFHAMAKSTRAPWFRTPWDISRSQSNLRVATTASPIAAIHDPEKKSEDFIRKLCKKLAKGCDTKF